MAVLEQRRPAGGTPPGDERAVLAKLSTLDRFLPLWIGLAMAAGLALGSLIPSLNDGLDRLRIGTVSLPIAALVLMTESAVVEKPEEEEETAAGHGHMH